MLQILGIPFWKKVASLSRSFASYTHKMLFLSEWCANNPENFDHNIDLYYMWPKYCIPHWLERGIYNVLAMQIFENPIVCELCCGEGFNTKFFYSVNAEKIYACDFDSNAIAEAKRKHNRENIEFVVADIRYQIPDTSNGKYFTNVIWDTAIEHFTEEEIDTIMRKIHDILSATNGIVSGHTIVKRFEGKSLEQHEYEFANMEDLKRFFSPYFKNVLVFETIYEDRHNLYFYASDGIIPFDNGWMHWDRKRLQNER